MTGSLTRRLVLICAVGLACFLAFSPVGTCAQTATSAIISGVITDQSHAVVPDATVVLEQKGTGASQTVTSGGDGHLPRSVTDNRH